MATENLKVKITADASQAKAEIGKFKDSLKGAVQAGESATKSIGKLTIALGGMMLAVKGVKKAVSNAIEVAAAGDAIKDNAQKVFMSTTAYQEWGYVLKQNGIEMGALKMGMRKFSQEVATGSDTLTKYGITATDVDTAFQQAVYTIQNMSSETEKIAAATELFGSRALELFPVLNLTNAETQSLMMTYRAIGGTMSNELIAASDKCTDSITEMKAAWGGLRNLLATYIIPVVTKVVQWLTLAIAKIRILIAAMTGVKETFGGNGKKSMPATTQSIATNTGNTANNLKKAAKHAKELKRTLMGIDELSRLAEKAIASAVASPSGGSGDSTIIMPSVSEGDSAGFNGLISNETMEKIAKFQEKVNGIKEKLHGAYLILKGVTELVFGNPIKGLKDIKDGILLLLPNVDKLKEKWANLKKNVKDITANIRAKIATKWADLKEKWANITTRIKSKTAEMKAKVGTKWGDLKERWNNLLAKFKDKTVEIKMKFGVAVADIKQWLNDHLFYKLNQKLANAPLVGDFFYKHPIWLAKGGVLTAPTPAIMGEYAGARSNPEIATPQSLMYETMQKANGDLVSAFATMTRDVISAIEGKDLSVRIGDEQIARSAQRGNTAYYNRTGKALLTI